MVAYTAWIHTLHGNTLFTSQNEMGQNKSHHTTENDMQSELKNCLFLESTSHFQGMVDHMQNHE